jgi:predicted transcriptional regulator
MRRTNIYLEEDQAARLDRLAAEQGTSRADLIRQLLDRGLRGEVDDVAAGLAAIDDSFGALAAADSPQRGPGERERHLARMWRDAS